MSVCLLMTLTACATYSGGRLPESSEDLRTCFERFAPKLPNEMTRREVIELLAAYDREDLKKTQCGKRLLAWVDGLKK